MAKPHFIPSFPEQSRLKVLLNLEKVQNLSVISGEEGDGGVDLQIEHAIDYLPGVCIDHYQLQKEADSISIHRKFCKGFDNSQPQQEIIQYSDSKKWFGLQSLFIPDLKGPDMSPSSWALARGVVLKHDYDLMWRFANPEFDPARRWLERGGGDTSEPAANFFFFGPEELKGWQSFAAFLGPLEGGLKNLIDQKSKLGSMQTAGPLFAQVFQKSATPPLGQLNTLSKKVYSKEEEASIHTQIEAILFSVYPFMPQKEREEAVHVVASWFTNRLLFEMGALFLEEKIRKDPTVVVPLAGDLPGELEALFKRNLSALLLDDNATVENLALLRKTYQADYWHDKKRSLETTALVSLQTVKDSMERASQRFDNLVAVPTFRNLLHMQSALDVKKREQTEKRLHALLNIPEDQELTEQNLDAGTTLVLWERLNEPFLSSSLDFLHLSPAQDNIAEGAAVNFVQEKMRKRNAELPGKAYLMTAPGAFEVVDEMMRLSRQGVENNKMRIGLGHAVLTNLLQAAEGDFLTLEPEAKDALILALADFPEMKLEEVAQELPAVVALPVAVSAPVAVAEAPIVQKDQWYQKWWVWTAAGAVLAAGGGAVAAHNLGGSEKPKPTPAKKPSGHGGNTNHPPTSSDDDGRGTTTTVGYLRLGF